ncbi:hypothetical protein Tco_1269314 [Tanacetum coccineum]
MAEQQTIKYAHQWNNMTVDNNILREFWSTIVAYDPFPSTDETEQCPLRDFLIMFLVLNGQRPLTLNFNTFCSSTGLDYNHGKYVAHLTPEAVLGENYSSTEQVNFIQQLLAFSLITRTEVDIGEIIYSDLLTKLLNKSRLKYVSYPRFISCALQVLLGSDYTQDKKFGFLPPILSNFTFTKDPSKVTDIELMAHMIAVNNWRDSVSPPPLAPKPKKGKSQTVTLTLPKSQVLEASGALSKKRNKPKSKKPPNETKVTPPKPMEGSEQSHSVSSGTVPDPQDLEKDIQLASMGFPSILDEGTRKSKHLFEGTATHPQDLGGNKQSLDRDITSMTPDEGMVKTMPHPEGSLGDKDSGGNIPPADMEPIHTHVADPLGTGDKYQDPQDDAEVRTPSPSPTQPDPSHVQEYASDSSSPDLKKFDNILPLTERQLIKYLRKMSIVLFNRITEKQWEQHEEAAVSYADLKASIDQYYDKNIAHRDQIDKLMEASMSSLDRSSTTISDLYKGLDVITQLLKDINNAVKDDLATNQKLNEAIETFARISSKLTEVLSLVKSFDFSALLSTMKDLQAHALKQEDCG